MNEITTMTPPGEGLFSLESWSTMQESGSKLRRAQSAWKERSLPQRLAVLREFRQRIAEDPMSLVRAGWLGRSTAEVLSSELIPLLDACRFLEKNAQRLLKPRKLGLLGRPVWLFGHIAEVQRVAWGVVLIIAPSNYPILLPGVQLLQALTAGNAVILKPGPGGSPAARMLLHLLEASGLPADLVEVLGEDKAAGRAALHREVEKVFFTGAASTGSRILQELAPRLLPSAMELSGSDAMVVLPDADMDLCARALSFGLQLNQGQTCIAPRRIFVASSRLKDFYREVREVFQRRPTFPLPAHRAADFLPHLNEALDNGAVLVAGFERAGGELQFPVVLANVPQSSQLWVQDFFLPVAVVTPFEDEQELLAGLEQSPYALGASIFSENSGASRALGAKINAGVISINDLIVPTADPRLPFGGRGRSGFGLTRGAEGLLEMTAVKVLTTAQRNWHPHFDSPVDGDRDFFVRFLQCSHGRRWGQRLWAFLKLIKLGKIRRQQSGSLPRKSNLH